MKLSDLNLVSLKLSPKLHLKGIQYLLKSECLDSDAEDKFKQFEGILIERQNMQSKTNQDSDQHHVSDYSTHDESSSTEGSDPEDTVELDDNGLSFTQDP